MQAIRALALATAVLASLGSLGAATLYQQTFTGGTGGFFSYAGDAGVSGGISNVSDALAFSITIAPANGGYFYGGTGATIGSLGTFSSLSDVTLSFDFSGSSNAVNGLGIIVKVDGGHSTSEVLRSVITGTQTFSMDLGTLSSFGGNLTAGDLSSSNLQILFTYGQGGNWGFNAGNPGTNVLTIDNVLLSSAAIPEPSSFAAIGGVFALGFVALRRRRRV